MGLWILDSCRHEWEERGLSADLDGLPAWELARLVTAASDRLPVDATVTQGLCDAHPEPSFEARAIGWHELPRRQELVKAITEMLQRQHERVRGRSPAGMACAALSFVAGVDSRE